MVLEQKKGPGYLPTCRPEGSGARKGPVTGTCAPLPSTMLTTGIADGPVS